MKWQNGSPVFCEGKFFLLEFAEGTRFIVVQCVIDWNEAVFIEQESYGRVTDTPKRYLEIPQ